MPSPKEPEKFVNEQGFSRDEFAQSLAEGLSDFARLAPPLPLPPAQPAQMSREIQDVTVTFPAATKAWSEGKKATTVDGNEISNIPSFGATITCVFNGGVADVTFLVTAIA